MVCAVTRVVKPKPLQITHEVIDLLLTAIILSSVFTHSHFKVISGKAMKVQQHSKTDIKAEQKPLEFKKQCRQLIPSTCV